LEVVELVVMAVELELPVLVEEVVMAVLDQMLLLELVELVELVLL
jgi:hypothetical protein